tara:strand:+ start:408 stop:608 length:201 start_codon:yes stop_codon:yes gene_type:complete
MNDFIFYLAVLLTAILGILYFLKQLKLSKDIALQDTTLDNLEEKLKKHKLIGGRHKRTNKRNPPIV